MRPMKQTEKRTGAYNGPTVPLGNFRLMLEGTADWPEDSEVRISISKGDRLYEPSTTYIEVTKA